MEDKHSAACVMQAEHGTAAQKEYLEWLRQAKGERRTSREYGVHGGAPTRPQQQPWPQEQQQQQQQQPPPLDGMQRQEQMLRQDASAQQQQQPGQRPPQPKAPERTAAPAPKPRAPKEIVLTQDVTAQQLAALLGANFTFFLGPFIAMYHGEDQGRICSDA